MLIDAVVDLETLETRTGGGSEAKRKPTFWIFLPLGGSSNKHKPEQVDFFGCGPTARTFLWDWERLEELGGGLEKVWKFWGCCL